MVLPVARSLIHSTLRSLVGPSLARRWSQHSAPYFSITQTSFRGRGGSGSTTTAVLSLFLTRWGLMTQSSMSMSAVNGQDSPGTEVIQRVDDVIKSPSDQRQYRALKLANGLTVMLVSDPETEKAAASLDVHVGHMKDPRELPGLAHFLEHMLFMGTKKFPNENEYSKFLNQHGGCSNAYTASDHTNFYFDVTSQHLPGALDRFAQFFLEPLFTESATEREVKAVNSEHDKNVASDSWRLRQLQQQFSDPEHDFNKFGTGNLETLWNGPREKGLDVRKALLQFHDHWYSSNIMTLCVLGQETLDELESLVVPLFSGVVNKEREVPSWNDHPLRDEDCRLVTYVVPIKDFRDLHVVFPIPDLRPYYKSGPSNYVSHLIGHEGEGSLLSLLKLKGWANSLYGGPRNGSKGFAFFLISVELTEEGLEHTDEIIGLIFQYLKMLRESGPQKWTFDETKSINEMRFRFKDKESPINYVEYVAQNLQYYSLQEVLFADYDLSEWKPELVDRVLENLVPEKTQVSIISQKFSDIANDTEKWYGTKYHSEPIPQEKLKRWTDEPVDPALRLPPPNPFIPTDFSLAPREEPNLPHPVIIKDTPLFRVWFKQDDQFLLPKSCIYFELRSPMVYLDPHHDNMTRIFVRLLQDDLNEFAYDAELAGLNYRINNTKVGLNLSIKGYNEKQSVLLEKLMSRMANFKINPDRFKLLKESYVRLLKNFDMEQPHRHAVYNSSSVLVDKIWMTDELVQALDELTIEAVQDFIPRFLSKLHIQSLMHGNLTEAQCLDLVDLVEKTLKTNCVVRPLLRSQMVRDRELQLEADSHHVLTKENHFHKSSCIEVYLQCGEVTPKEKMIMELFAHLINEPCFNILRTQEQLGYIVWSGSRRQCGVQGLRFIIQSDKHPNYLDDRIESFLASVPKLLEDMSDEEFSANRTALKEKILEKPKRLSSLSYMYWAEIVSQQYNFDRDNLEATELDQISKSEVIQFFDKYFSRTAPRKKLSCHIISKAEGGAGLEEAQPANGKIENAQVIDDLLMFKSSRPLHPVPKPFMAPENFLKDKCMK